MEKHPYIIGVYDDEAPLIEAAQAFKDKGVPIQEIFTPYPIHEIINIQGETSKLTVAAYIYGWIGALSVLAFMYYTAVIDWPLNYGGKPVNSFPSFILVTLVFTIFFVTIMSLTTFIFRARLFPGKKVEIVDPRATDDKFIMICSREGADRKVIEDLFRETGASDVYEKEL
jgi:hypothetical protein